MLTFPNAVSQSDVYFKVYWSVFAFYMFFHIPEEGLGWFLVLLKPVLFYTT